MLPVLFNFGGLKIYTFGVFLALAFFWGLYLLWKLIRLTSFKEEEIFDGVFISLFGALFIGRVVYVAANFNKFGFSLAKFILINGYPGMSLYGCLVGSLFFLYLYIRSKKLVFEELIDYFIPPFFLAIAFGKLGSFFSGVEAGTRTNIFLAVKYIGYFGGRHLTPIYEALLFFLAVYLSYRFLFEIRREKYPKGFNLYFFSWYFALVYFAFDKIKETHLYFSGYSLNQWLSAILVLTFSFYFLYYFRSLIITRFLIVIKNISNYGQKTYKKISGQVRGKFKKGQRKDSKTNKRIEKE